MNFFIQTSGSDFPVLDIDTQNAILSAIFSDAVDRVNITLGVGDDVAPVTFGDIVEEHMPAGSINTYLITARVNPNPFASTLVGISKRERPRLLLANVSGNIA